MPPVGFEPTVSAGERPQTHALDRAATGTGKCGTMAPNICGPSVGNLLRVTLLASRILR